jgi:endonuclease/exonuclease/phosphatase family metal-dependent hydrolase
MAIIILSPRNTKFTLPSGKGGGLMKLVSYNIQYSLGKDGVYDLERIVEAVKGADVIALQEVTRAFSQVPDADQPARIAELLPDFYWVYSPSVDLDASIKSDDGSIINKRYQFGNMLLSRWPILSSRLILLPRMRTYDKMNPQAGALEGVVDCPGGALRVYSVHLNHLNGAERMAQIDFLLPKLFNIPLEGGSLSGSEQWASELREVVMPEQFVVLGDCNLTPHSPEYTRVVGAPDYFYGARIAAPHLVDMWVQAGNPQSGGVTWYDESKDFQNGLRLDYGFASPGLAQRVEKAWIDNEAPGSDHQPTWFELARCK